MKMRQQSGFTLIELVMVIVILGILAAFALPRFADLTSEARIATVEGLAGSVRSASAIAHAMALAQDVTAGTVSMEGTNVDITNSYPDATATGILAALQDSTGFTPNTPAAGTYELRANGAATPANCQVSYTQPAAAGTAPTITLTTTGC